MGFTGFHLISIGFYRVLLDNAKLKGVLTDLTDFYRVFTGFSSVLLGLTMVYWVILGCTWFDRVSITLFWYLRKQPKVPKKRNGSPCLSTRYLLVELGFT